MKKQNKLYFFCPSCFLPAEEASEVVQELWEYVYRPTDIGPVEENRYFMDSEIISGEFVHKRGGTCESFYSKNEVKIIPYLESLDEFKKWVEHNLDVDDLTDALHMYGSIEDWWEAVKEEF